MALCQKPVHLDWRIASLFVIIALLLSACGGELTPTPTPEPTRTPIAHVPLFYFKSKYYRCTSWKGHLRRPVLRPSGRHPGGQVGNGLRERHDQTTRGE